MTNEKIASILNTKIVPNTLGEDVTIAEDLSNVSQVGVAMADLTTSDLFSYMKDFILGVYYDWIEGKTFDEETFGMYVTREEFPAVWGRLRARMIPAMDSHITTLVSKYADASAPDYTDGHFYGIQTDQEFWPQTESYKLAHSWGVEYYKKCFMNAENARRFAAECEKCAEDSATYMLNALARRNLCNLATAAYTGGRKIQLFTAYNSKHGYQEGDAGYVDITNWDLDPEFKLFCQATVIKLKKYIRNLNAKYNDGTIPNYTPEKDARSVLLTEFAVELDFNQSVVYHQELTDIGQHYDLDFWQNQTNEMLPIIEEDSEFDSIVTTDGTTTTTISHVMGLIYDRYSAIIREELNKITEKPVPEEDFVTFFHHFQKAYGVDTRESGIVLVLE